MPILQLDKVTKRYRDHLAVDEVSFEVQPGTIFGMLGPNGAGKTSTIRIITTITDQTAARFISEANTSIIPPFSHGISPGRKRPL
ncbi:MAG: ATP-binding cassette domain-containing protein [Saprospiraceae bacterium]|nr:ATP-binding cassette domain-containing protein [Candidatus Opimibacter skivensis]